MSNYAYAWDVHAGSSDGASVDTTGDPRDSTGITFFVAAVSALYGTPGAISDSKGNTWNPLGEQTNGTHAVRLYWCLPTSVGSGHTFSASAAYSSLLVLAFTGDPAVSPADQSSGAASAAGSTAQPGGITPTVANCLVVTALAYNPNSGATVDSGFTGFDQPHGLYAMSLAVGYLIQTTATLSDPTWTFPGYAGTPASVQQAFKLASSPLVAGTAEFLSSGPNDGAPYIAVKATAPTGGTGAGPTYQWERSVDGGSYADVSGATALTLVDTDVTTGHVYSYRCKQTRGSETVTTNAVTGQVYPPLARWVPRPHRGRGRGR